MSVEQSITKSNYIDYDKVLNLGKKLMQDGNDNVFGFYLIVGINVGLRIGDILNLKNEDFNFGSVTFREEKTKKSKTVVFNDKILSAYKNLNKRSSEYTFLSQKGSVFSKQQINRKIKKYFVAKNKNYSSHSLRKSFGRRVYENNNQSEYALMKLSELYNHSSLKITRDYLDITQEELNDIYMSL